MEKNNQIKRIDQDKILMKILKIVMHKNINNLKTFWETIQINNNIKRKKQ